MPPAYLPPPAGQLVQTEFKPAFNGVGQFPMPLGVEPVNGLGKRDAFDGAEEGNCLAVNGEQGGPQKRRRLSDQREGPTVNGGVSHTVAPLAKGGLDIRDLVSMDRDGRPGGPAVGHRGDSRPVTRAVTAGVLGVGGGSSRDRVSTGPHASEAVPTGPGSPPEDKPYRCKVEGCDRAYKKLNGLIYHNQSSHAAALPDDPKPFKCTVEGCAKAYRNSNGLELTLYGLSITSAYHLEHGHGAGLDGVPRPSGPQEGVEKPYICPYKGCGKAYKNPNGLSYHLQKGKLTGHSVEENNQGGMKPFVCAVSGCAKAYRNPGALATHIEKVHGEHQPGVNPAPELQPTKSVFCPSCMRQFKSTSGLEHHMTTVHNMNNHHVKLATSAQRDDDRVVAAIAEATTQQRSQLQQQGGFDSRQPHHDQHYQQYHSYYEGEDDDDGDGSNEGSEDNIVVQLPAPKQSGYAAPLTAPVAAAAAIHAATAGQPTGKRRGRPPKARDVVVEGVVVS
ncbi:Transcriptional regulator of ribosomal biogenesis proteins [Borealophlyctis nickersoniae]|nr:Transcriptional regulator of ribosomal biogenesis proteins [Borealophlyctis nickersoniae]